MTKMTAHHDDLLFINNIITLKFVLGPYMACKYCHHHHLRKEDQFGLNLLNFTTTGPVIIKIKTIVICNKALLLQH
jgi:hypothetical protein